MKAKTISQTYWCRMRAGWYAKQVGQDRFDIEWDEENRLWRCRVNGIEFDAAASLKQAKNYCVPQ